MDNRKIGNFICELRREKGMTQKGLAEKLNVTDKAVSKWERGAGYPEITLIPQLADVLEVSSGELLLGERSTGSEKENSAQENPPMTLIADTIEYVNQYKGSKANRIALISMTFAFLTAAFVCLLCNYVIDKTFSWSLYVVGSEAAAWLIVSPLLAGKRHRVAMSLAALTITVMPLLMLIEHLCPAKGWVFPFAFSITAVSLAGLWLTAILFACKRIRHSGWFRASIVTFVFGNIVNLSINGIVRYYLSTPANISAPVVAFSCAFSAVVLAIIGNLKRPAKG
jgi:Predicted transcriptional regulators